ncbi:MAG: PEGA domain-containing protein [Candidatus Competibacteraceae bacterium]|nr:PEGA domain-containing protein [Candidatus Competibacteraceae bacterium]
MKQRSIGRRWPGGARGALAVGAKSFWALAAFALWCGCFGEPARAAAEPAREPVPATVIEFSVRGELNEQAGAIIADLMMSAIANTGRFTLKDRLPLSAAAKIAKAQELGSTGLLDPKTAAELGRLYGVDAVVTGGVSKLGDLITVTARLIDTKTASLLGSGQVQDKSIDAIQIKVNDLAAMVLAPPAPPPTYALAVRTDPADASVRLLNHPTPYQPGMRLPAGDYEIEVSKPGHVARKAAVNLRDRDLTLDVVLEKARYGLTVRPNPPDARIKLLGAPAPYQPGVALPPGDYELEVSREGYLSHKFPIRIVDSELSVPVSLDKAPPPLPPPVRQYRLTVQVDPSQATVRLLNGKTPYRPGVALAPGNYTVDIRQAGYEPAQVTVPVIDSDVTVPVKLAKKPEPPKPVQRLLTVWPDPPDARIRLLGVKTAYQPGVSLPPGNYTVEVSKAGYETQRLTARIADSDVTVPVTLVKQPEPVPPTLYRLTVRTDPTDARIRLPGSKRTYADGVSLPPGNYTVEVSKAGYQSQRLTARIADSDVTVPVTLVKQPEPEPPTLYRLTVRPDPPDARVRLLGSRTVYRPGVSLPPGNYTVEIAKAGYESQRVAARIADGDVTVPVTLVKQPEPEPPTLYRLTVRPDPPDASVRFLGSRSSYRPGVTLPPGSYGLEVSKPGYETQRLTARVVDGDVALSVTLTKEPEPSRYALTVRPEPSDARVRLRGTSTVYRPGLLLAPGSYTVEVSSSGYETRQVPVRIADGDVTLPVALAKQPELAQYRLTVRPEPASARVRLANSARAYRPGMLLPPGSYTVEVESGGYESRRVAVQIADGDVMLPVELERVAKAPAPAVPPTPSPTPTRAGEWRIGAVQVDSSLNGVDRAEIGRLLGGYTGRTATRATLLDSAMRAYQATGVTLSFVVRDAGATGGATLYARAARQARRTYESSISIISRSQLENSGFGVSVE